MSYNFLAAAAGSGDSISLPKEGAPAIMLTIGHSVSIEPDTEFNSKTIKRRKDGSIIDKWVVSGTTGEGSEVRLYIDKGTAKAAVAKAMQEAGVEGFHTGDVLTIENTGKVTTKRGNTANTYKATLQHNGGNLAAVNENMTSAGSTAEQVAAGYDTSAPAPAAPQGYGAQQGYPQQGYAAPQAPTGYPQQGYATQPPQAPQAPAQQAPAPAAPAAPQGYAQQAPAPNAPQGYGTAAPATDNPWDVQSPQQG